MSELSRRTLLKAAGALATVPAIGSIKRLLPNDGFSFAFFSDSHVGLTHGIREDRAMFEEMRGLPLDFGINAGDVTDYGWAAEYGNYRRLLSILPFRVHHAPGNHDVRWSPLGPKAYKVGSGDAMFASFNHKGVHFVTLDSTIPLSHYGHFESAMLRWLERDLKIAGPDIPVFLAFHHWVGRDVVMVDNEAALFAIIEPYNVKVLLTGHGHSDLLWTWNGVSATMNKGLYQLSYERVDIDRIENKAVLSRRTSDHPSMQPILGIGLRRMKEKRRVWRVQSNIAPESGAISVGLGDAEYRWDDQRWVRPTTSIGSVELDVRNLAAGSHSLSFRTEPNTYFYSGETHAHGSSGVLQKRWERKLSGGVMSHLRVHEGVLYVSTMDGTLAAIASADGTIKWRASTGGYMHSSPVIVGEMVVVGSSDGAAYAFDRVSGHRRWHFMTGGPVYGSGAVAKGVVCIGSGDGFIYGLDTTSGKQKWRYELPRSYTSFVQSPAATDGVRFFLGAWDKHLYSLDAQTGELAWKRDCCGAKAWPYSPAIGGPAVGLGRVFVPTDGNDLWAFDAVSGEPAWRISSPGDKFGYSSPCLIGDRIYIGCLGNKGEARCVSASTGAILWTVGTGSVIYDSSPSVSGDVVVIGSVSGLVTAASATDGRILGQYRMPTGHLLASPASEPGAAYVGSFSDSVVRFDIIVPPHK